MLVCVNVSDLKVLMGEFLGVGIRTDEAMGVHDRVMRAIILAENEAVNTSPFSYPDYYIDDYIDDYTDNYLDDYTDVYLDNYLDDDWVDLVRAKNDIDREYADPGEKVYP